MQLKQDLLNHTEKRILYEATTQYQNSGVKSYYLSDGKIEMQRTFETWNEAGMYNLP